MHMNENCFPCMKQEKNIHFTASFEGSLSEKILSIEVELAKYLTNLNYTRSPVRYISNPIGKCILQILVAAPVQNCSYFR